MIRSLFAVLFLLCLKLSSSRNVGDYIRQKYDGPTLRSFRQLESSTKKWKKAIEDEEFLLYCKLNNVIPNFIKFKLYRSSLYNTDFYASTVLSLLDMEIKHKSKCIQRLQTKVSELSDHFYSTLSVLDRIYCKNIIKENIDKYVSKVKRVHDRKLLKLGIRKPRFMLPNDVIFNYSNYVLSKKEEFLLSLGLDFCLPNFKPNYTKLFLHFELMFNMIKNLPHHIDLESTRRSVQAIAHKALNVCKYPSWFPFFKKEDFSILKKLSERKDIVICSPDKGKGVVILNHDDYVEKMNDVLSDQNKFIEIGTPDYKTIFKLEDKINRTLKQFKDEGVIDNKTYDDLYCSGSSFGILYGLPKVHKNNVPLRPILAAYNAPNFNLAKFLVPILNKLTSNPYTLLNSATFIPQILRQNANSFMVSFDVQSLFTNVPLQETIDIILNKLFPTPDSIVNGFNRVNFEKLLELAVMNTNFIFNGKLYKQVDGMAMGSPLGPTFANIFMCHLEEQFISQCPDHFKPRFYKRYVDDTFVLFSNRDAAQSFLNFINNYHPNITFTMDVENNDKLPFLDINVCRTQDGFSTGIFRKDTFTGLGQNFFSYCLLDFKLNSCKTLLFRAFSLCSNWINFHDEIVFLRNYFANNCYPLHVFDRTLRRFLDNIYRPKVSKCTVPKLPFYISLPYMGNFSLSVRKELSSKLSELYPYVQFNLTFSNPLTIGSLFKFKDRLPELMRSGVVYEFNCPKCNLGKYVGCTSRLLKVRIDSHRGVSHRTGINLSNKEFSAIRSHCLKCRHIIGYTDFKILAQVQKRSALSILESLYIKQLSPQLNSSTTSTPLQIA